MKMSTLRNGVVFTLKQTKKIGKTQRNSK